MRRRKAFTLIELLVVVAIIALLVSILVPSLQHARSLAKTVVCANNERNLALAINMYCEDSNGVLQRFWYDALRPVLGKSMDYVLWEGAGGYGPDLVGTTANGLSCPVIEDSVNSGIYNPEDGPCGPYGINCYNLMKPGGNFHTEMIGQFFKTPATTYLLADAYTAYIWAPNCHGKFALTMDFDGDGIIDSPWVAGLSPLYAFDFFRPRHPRG